MSERLEHLEPHMAIPYGGDRITRVPPELAATFAAGDRLIVLQNDGRLLHVPREAQIIAQTAVTRAREAFETLQRADDDAISGFFARFAERLEDRAIWAEIAEINTADVARARAAGRSITRLIASETLRADMIAGLRSWRDAAPGRGRVAERLNHGNWSVELITAPLGVVGFVFEGRPNVLADAAGVIRSGDSVVFRIGSDALETARAMMRLALRPALTEAGLPEAAALLLESPAHAAGWALFNDSRLSLAVARGSGPAVAQLGQIARQAGTPVSLHGTGGAWLLAHHTADPARLEALIAASLDRKVCNTLNVCLLPRSQAEQLLPAVLAGLEAAGAARGVRPRLHAGPQAWPLLPSAHPPAEPIAREDLGTEWEWDEVPELSLEIVEDLDEAISLFNRLSPRFVASVIARDEAVIDQAFDALDAAFVGDGFTRWVDGQFALGRPELGLANWQGGRLLARGGILSGDGVFTLKTRMRQGSGGMRR